MDLAMGGYGVYVWSSVGLTLLVLGINLWRAQAALAAARRAVARAHGAAEGGR
jgi:heme exporter protein CcmD